MAPVAGGLGFNGRGFLGLSSLPEPPGPALPGVFGLGVLGFVIFAADPLRLHG